MQVPVWLLNIIYKCLEKLPDNRYGNGIAVQEAIVQNSMSSGNTDNSIIVLKTENETLQTQLLQLQEERIIAKKTTVTLPKFVFNGAVGIIIILLCLSTYGFLHKKVIYQASPQTSVDYVPLILSYKPIPIPTAVTYKKDSVSNARKARGRATVASKKKPHRKKFLGLF